VASVVGAIVVVMVVAACSDGGGGNTEAGNAQRRALEEDFPFAQRYVEDPAIRRLLRSCPVTRSNHSIPPGEEDNPGAEQAAYYGNGKLWTGLYGITRQMPEGVKFPWWREVRGPLTIKGRRLDGRAPALRAKIPAGYGLIDFQSSRVFFPTPGCWRITGMVGDERLSFVTLVVKPMDE
jgi:hypothetical protein